MIKTSPVGSLKRPERTCAHQSTRGVRVTMATRAPSARNAARIQETTAEFRPVTCHYSRDTLAAARSKLAGPHVRLAAQEIQQCGHGGGIQYDKGVGNAQRAGESRGERTQSGHAVECRLGEGRSPVKGARQKRGGYQAKRQE